MVMILFMAHRHNYPKGNRLLGSGRSHYGRRVLGTLTMFIILGGILSGVFHANGSAAVACIYAFIITMFVYRDYKWRELPPLMARVCARWAW